MVKFKNFVKKELTLCISFVVALASCIFVKPDRAYFGYLDFRTLALLYCLMIIVIGLRNAGAFDALSYVLCNKAHSARALGLVLVGLCFVIAMLITNDVALLTFVPFTIIVLKQAKATKHLVWIVVLETVAVNIGSMLTPVGNPQNLYLFSYYDMSFGDFIVTTGPVWIIAGVFIALLCLILPKNTMDITLGEKPKLNKKDFMVYLVLFFVCLSTVLRILPWYWMFGIVVLTLIIYQPKILGTADFFLLLTFICFFVFSGNLGRIESIHAFLSDLLLGRELLVGAITSQVISNVPAAILLSGFTRNGNELLLGVNIGGLGTPIASLASLISLKLYCQCEESDSKKYMKWFLIVNFGLLLILLLMTELFQI